MTKSNVGVDSIAVPSSFSLFGDVTNIQQVGDYLPRRPFRYANSISQIPGSYPGVASDIAQH
jgi:hypothetical protein